MTKANPSKPDPVAPHGNAQPDQRQSGHSKSGHSKSGTAAKPLEPGLYLVATPIGNLRDITLRALDVLRGVDLIACEDTRVTRPLLTHYGIGGRLIAYHDFNADKARPVILDALAAGKAVALVSDAGSPMISDPGYKLVADLVAAGHAVTAVPGPSALVTAVQLSALPSDRFFFAGFLDSRSAARRRDLEDLARVPAALVIYESARRLPESLADMAAILGDRPAAIARELTKLYEEVRRGSLADLAAHYVAAGPPKGEVVVMIGPPQAGQAASDAADIDRLLRDAMAQNSLRDAADLVAQATGLRRKEVYARALALAKDESGTE